MNVIATATSILERVPVPDPLLRFGIAHLIGRTHRRMNAAASDVETVFASGMQAHPIAEHADAANAQHYELPAAFLGLVLGPHRKYSSCLYQGASDTLEQAEINALTASCAHADLRDGQTILELGCGWGSLSLWMASRYPNARITAVSNSGSQRDYISAARYPFSSFACAGVACSAIVWLNAVSVAILLAFLGILSTGLAYPGCPVIPGSDGVRPTRQ